MCDIKELEKWQIVGIACLVFVITGFVGWLVEFGFYYLDNGIVYWKGGNFLPWINMYSIGALLVFIFTYKFRKKPLYVFLISVVILGMFEFLTGFVLFKCFGIRYWNYQDEFLNIGGYVCLISLVCIGIGGVFVMNFLIPLLTKISKIQSKKVFLFISIGLCALVLSDEIYNFFITKLFNLPTAIDFYR